MSKKIFFKTIMLLIVLSVLLVACNQAPEEEEVDTESIIATSIAETMQVMMETEQAQPTATTASTATSATSEATATTATTAGAVALPTVAVAPNCLVAGLVSETIPDGSLIAKETTFTKTWRIINSGTCPWSTAYKFVFVDGNALGAPAEVKLPENVNPGGITNVTMTMKAPNVDATYTGTWMFQTDTGVNIAPFTVKIVVGVATPTPIPPYAVTSVTTNVNSGIACPADQKLKINITSNGAGIVKYYTVFDGSNNPIKSIEFLSAGTKEEVIDWAGLNIGSHELYVYIDIPNNQLFGPFKCP